MKVIVMYPNSPKHKGNELEIDCLSLPSLGTGLVLDPIRTNHPELSFLMIGLDIGH